MRDGPQYYNLWERRAASGERGGEAGRSEPGEEGADDDEDADDSYDQGEYTGDAKPAGNFLD